MDDEENEFKVWKQQVNSIIEDTIGLSCDDLEDCCYRDWFDDGVSPKTAAKRAIQNSGGSVA